MPTQFAKSSVTKHNPPTPPHPTPPHPTPPHPTPTRGGMSTLFSTPKKVLFLVHFLPFWHRRFVLDLFGHNLRSFGISVFDPVEFRAIWPFLSKLLHVKKVISFVIKSKLQFHQKNVGRALKVVVSS